MSAQKPERVAKVIARSGICSRREAERWIANHRVQVDGKMLLSPAFTVDSSNIILIDGKLLPRAQKTRLWRYHKPTGLVTSHSDPQGRRTVFGNLSPKMGRVISIGRLDFNSEGLLLLTNDGELARQFEIPSNEWIRRYRVRVRGTVDQTKLKTLQNGITIAGVNYKSIKATLDSETRTNAWLTVTLTEGKNREIRKILEDLNLKVNRLIRISYGPFELGKLGRSQVDEVQERALHNQLTKNKYGVSVKFRRAGWAKPKKGIKQMHNKKKSSQHSVKIKK